VVFDLTILDELEYFEDLSIVCDEGRTVDILPDPISQDRMTKLRAFGRLAGRLFIPILSKDGMA